MSLEKLGGPENIIRKGIVLIVEDNKMSVMYLCKALDDLNKQSVSAEDG